jgi:hypothetical protein
MKLVEIAETCEIRDFPVDELYGALAKWWVEAWGGSESDPLGQADDAGMGVIYAMLVHGLPDDVPSVVQKFVDKARS